MNHALIGLAFAAGLVAALNPCGFAMLPAYLLLVVRGRQSASPLSAAGRALAATLGMALGFMTVFGVFGVLTIAAASTVQRYLPYVTVVIGVALTVLGAWLLTGRELTGPAPFGPRWAPTARLGSFYGYGVSYAIASLSCTVGPFLAVTGAGLRSGSALDGVAVYGAYIAGLTLVVGALAILTAAARSTVVARMRAVLPFVNRLSGVLLILVGAYVSYYGVYEVRLFGANANPEDAVIAAAGRLQGTVAGWVHSHGAWPWVFVLAIALVGALAGTWRRRRRGRDTTTGCA
ncbi:cytochrome c biogenesis CcdA family protein [Mycobacterium sp. Z3061]|uniref:cytochrome c biogenesis CcdA family protein n=1 Tax=Mycobacterium sp. Z3061 TaxID=3073562 RepID=UPI002873CC80|nr:cytochrome c biogenesis CcdA family protein [Mycobacterium sp. Z3061]